MAKMAYYNKLISIPTAWRPAISKAARAADMTVTAWIRKAIESALKSNGRSWK